MAPQTCGDGIVIIGYGNELRGDDGIGPRVAVAMLARGWPGVRALAVPQLTPELAEVLAGARLAIFVDAAWSRDGEAVSATPVEPAAADSPLTHLGAPGELLRLAQAVYGRAPEAWLVTVAGEEFGLTDRLSPAALRHSRLAREHIADLVRRGVSAARE
jgi:hydrogenase maturation protease